MTAPATSPASDTTALAVPVAKAAGLTVNDALPLGQMVKALTESTLVPKEYQGNPANVLIAIEVAQRIGASPFAVMQNLDIIHGRPSWRATFLIATVNASRKFSPLRFKFEGKPGTPEWGCRAWAKDATGEECVGALITIALAASEGWAGKSGSKWKTMPEQMLMYRAAAFWTRVYCPELSLGIRTTDEVEDMDALAEAVKPATVSAVEQRVMALPAPAAAQTIPTTVPETKATEPAEKPANGQSHAELTAKHTLPPEHPSHPNNAGKPAQPASGETKPANGNGETKPADPRTGLRQHRANALHIVALLDKGFPLDEFNRLVAANGGEKLSELDEDARAQVLKEMRDTKPVPAPAAT